MWRNQRIRVRGEKYYAKHVKKYIIVYFCLLGLCFLRGRGSRRPLVDSTATEVDSRLVASEAFQAVEDSGATIPMQATLTLASLSRDLSSPRLHPGSPPLPHTHPDRGCPPHRTRPGSASTPPRTRPGRLEALLARLSPTPARTASLECSSSTGMAATRSDPEESVWRLEVLRGDPRSVPDLPVTPGQLTPPPGPLTPLRLLLLLTSLPLPGLILPALPDLLISPPLGGPTPQQLLGPPTPPPLPGLPILLPQLGPLTNQPLPDLHILLQQPGTMMAMTVDMMVDMTMAMMAAMRMAVIMEVMTMEDMTMEVTMVTTMVAMRATMMVAMRAMMMAVMRSPVGLSSSTVVTSPLPLLGTTTRLPRIPWSCHRGVQVVASQSL